MEGKPRSLFDAISDFPHNIGIYLTYTLDTKVINKLTEHSTGTIVILHDYRQGQSLNYNRNSSIINIPVKARTINGRNCFHSKLAILKNNNEAKIIIGSANLSRQSFLLPEKEIVFEMTVKFEENESVEFYTTIVKYLTDLKSLLPFNQDVFDSVLQKMHIHGLRAKVLNSCRFIYNTVERSIFSEITSFAESNKITKPPDKAWVATPFVSIDYPSVLTSWGENVSFYLRNGSKIPEAFKNCRIFLANENGRRKLFHSKIIVLQYDRTYITYIGSANFSDQGFFKSNTEFGNQENGVVFKSSKNLLERWFDLRYWSELIDIEKYEEEAANLIEFLDEPKVYAWAETRNHKITVYLYNPDHEIVKQHGKRVLCENIGDDFFRTDKLVSVKTEESEIVKFKVGNSELDVAVFRFDDFITNAQKKESLFDLFNGIYSVIPAEMDKVIESEKIKVDQGSKISISEPPKLEQYFQNVKRQMKYIKLRKFFTESNLEEVNKRLSGTSDIRVLYLALQLLRTFKSKSGCESLESACLSRISDLAKKFDINENDLQRFIKSWLLLKS